MRKPIARPRPVFRRLTAELLEPRCVPATLTVTNTYDIGPGSLRQAILSSNTAPGRDQINFAIPGGGIHTITPLSALPIITDWVSIDGTTQPGYSGTPLIELNGASATGYARGFQIICGECTVRGLAINRFAVAGIELDYGGGNVIEGNFIGTDPTGTVARHNVGSSRVDLQACKLEYSIVSPK